MAEVARCPACGHEFLYSPEAAGRTRPCPKCRHATALGPSAAGARPESRTDRDTRAGGGPSAWPAAPQFGPPPVPAVRPGIILKGRYEIADELGRGGFGVVYRAYDTHLKRKAVAVKVLLEKALTTPDAVRRFRSEAELLCQVQHAQVPAVLDLGEVGGQQYMVFAFVNGKTVRELIPPGGFADPVAAVRLAAKLVRTLHDIYAGYGILHRDVKPANMMVPHGQADGLYLMDFGLAVCHAPDEVRDAEARTAEGTVIGTPWYMSPEQVGGKIQSIGHASDLYSASAVLYHLLTGRPPFDSRFPKIMADILFATVEPPSRHRAGLDADLDALVMRGLSKRAADRYATGTDFAERLERWAARRLVHGTRAGGRDPGGATAPWIESGRDAEPSRPIPLDSAESVVTGSTLSAPPGAQVIVIKALPAELPPADRSWVLKLAAAVVALVFLIIGVYAVVQMSRSKPEPRPPAPAPTPAPGPEGKMQKWER